MHRRLGHLNFQHMWKMGLEYPVDPRQCRPCHLCKGVQMNHPRVYPIKSTVPLQLVHSDICYPTIPDLHGNKYFLTFTDDYSRFTHVYLLRNESEALERFMEYKAAVEKLQGLPILELRVDNAGEFTSGEFREFAKGSGICLSPTCPYSPQSNGVAERMNRILNEKVRTMLCDAKLPNVFWGLAIQAACHLKNRCRTAPLNNIPYCLWLKEENCPLSYLKVWGCLVNVLIPFQRRTGKYEETSYEGIFVGYCRTSESMYLVYNPMTKKIATTQDVRFHEDMPAGTFFRMDISAELIDFDDTQREVIIPRPGPVIRNVKCPTVPVRKAPLTGSLLSQGRQNARTRPLALREGDSRPLKRRMIDQVRTSVTGQPHAVRSPNSSSITSMVPNRGGGTYPTPESPLTSGRPNSSGEEQLSTRRRIITEEETRQSLPSAEMPPSRSVTIPPARTITSRYGRLSKPVVIYDPSIRAVSLLQSRTVCPPVIALANVTVKEALAGEEAQRWKEAMNEEYRGLMRLNSWDLVPRPRDAKLIPCHWILTTKKDHNGKVVRYKARLVAGGNF